MSENTRLPHKIPSLTEHVAELYAEPDRDAEIDKEDSQQPRIKLDKAIEALQKLRLYKEQTGGWWERLLQLY